MDSIKLTKLQKKEMKKVIGGEHVNCPCSTCPSCNCGGGDTIPSQTLVKHSNGGLVSSINFTDMKTNPEPSPAVD
ncbi:MAG: hypothetical protein MJZ91_04685 [Bacteroidales bacterium]|nr:hypothetical protein [Bacteroidales bacterium]